MKSPDVSTRTWHVTGLTPFWSPQMQSKQEPEQFPHQTAQPPTQKWLKRLFADSCTRKVGWITLEELLLGLFLWQLAFWALLLCAAIRVRAWAQGCERGMQKAGCWVPWPMTLCVSFGKHWVIHIFYDAPAKSEIIYLKILYKEMHHKYFSIKWHIKSSIKTPVIKGWYSNIKDIYHVPY